MPGLVIYVMGNLNIETEANVTFRGK